jgi:cyclic pyranopterin phosphate synthase
MDMEQPLPEAPAAPQMPEKQMPEKHMIDPHGRAVTYLRVSVTDRCDFRCV